MSEMTVMIDALFKLDHFLQMGPRHLLIPRVRLYPVVASPPSTGITAPHTKPLAFDAR